MNKNYILESYRKIGPNFMTPTILEYVMTPDGRIIELSKGTDLGGADIWGVSEFQEVDSRLETTKRGQMHRSKASARKHFHILSGAF